MNEFHEYWKPVNMSPKVNNLQVIHIIKDIGENEWLFLKKIGL